MPETFIVSRGVEPSMELGTNRIFYAKCCFMVDDLDGHGSVFGKRARRARFVAMRSGGGQDSEQAKTA